jgi:uncharacterized protein YqgC (DUF456 family)
VKKCQPTFCSGAPDNQLTAENGVESGNRLHLGMDWLWIILGILLILAGIAGSLLPLLPGPPIAYVGLLLQQLKAEPAFTTKFLLIWAGIVILTLVLDYLVPIWGTKKFGGSKYGVWGCTLGFLAAFWMGPWGVILGPFLGAFLGEMIAGKNSKQSFRAAMGSFIGFIAGSFFKLVACFFMLYYVIQQA